MGDYDNKPRASDAIGTQTGAQEAEQPPKIEIQDEAQEIEGLDVEQSEPETRDVEQSPEIEMQDGVQDEVQEQNETGTQDTEPPETEEQRIEQDDDPAPEVVMDETASDEQELAPRRTFSWPSRAQILGWLPFWLVIGLGAVLRFWNLGARPLHHDESLHAYFSLMLLHFNIENWSGCLNGTLSAYCYKYDPLLHGPFQFHAIAIVYLISQLLHVADNGVNTTTVRIAAATLGTVIVGLPYFVRDRLGNLGAWLACFLLAVSPSMVYYSRFAREDIYMACWTLLLVVAVARYLSTRKASWLIWAAAAFALSYATKEATFLTIAVFGSFIGGLVAWELGKCWRLPRERQQEEGGDAVGQRDADTDNRRGALYALILYILVMLPLALILFGVLKELSIYTNPPYTRYSDQIVAQIKNVTLIVVPILGIVLGAFVVYKLWREMREDIVMMPERRGLAKRIDPLRQPLLDTIFSTPWTYWFFAVVVAWAIFLVLFTVLFTNIRQGIADGIWQGLYYWIQQQGQARGAQPWYYYFLLIPLYEQIGVVFGIVGVARALLRPTRFRLFLVYWCVGNLFIYTWAAEKMPWLMIHITMPMMLLAALGLEPVVRRLVVWGGAMLRQRKEAVASARPAIRAGRRVPVGALASLVVAICLLIVTLQNMFQVNYVHYADAPHEMMIYVQTTTDVNIVMSKINTLDQEIDGGRHELAIGVTNDGTWPMIWYLRDYTNVCYNFPGGCPNDGKDVQVIITGDDPPGTINTIASQYASAPPGKTPAFTFHVYHMRSWWDEGYKPPDCTPNAANNYCAGAPAYVGPWLWLSYGDNPPPGAKFNPVLAAQHIWEWWWQRRPFGATDGAYDMGLFIRSNLPVSP